MIDESSVDGYLRQLNEGSQYVTLRRMLLSDACQTLAWRNSPKARFLNKGAQSVEEQERWITSRPSTEINLIISAKNGTDIGMVALVDIDLKNKKVEAGRLLLTDDAQKMGKPFVIEALTMIYELAFNYIDLNKVYGMISSDNKLMIKFHLYMGLKKEGVLRAYYKRPGGYLDCVCVGLLKQEFLEHVKKRSIIMLQALNN